MERKIIQSTSFVEKDAVGAPVKDIQWEATQAQTDGVKIEDPGMGRPIILRNFEYRFPIGPHKKPTIDEILTPDYIKHLENGLWADNMEMIMKPKVVFYKKGFRVFVTCQAKKGNIIPRFAQEQLKPLQTKIQQNA